MLRLLHHSPGFMLSSTTQMSYVALAMLHMFPWPEVRIEVGEWASPLHLDPKHTDCSVNLIKSLKRSLHFRVIRSWLLGSMGCNVSPSSLILKTLLSFSVKRHVLANGFCRRKVMENLTASKQHFCQGVTGSHRSEISHTFMHIFLFPSSATYHLMLS